MSTVAHSAIRTLADLLDRLGRVPLERIRFHPPPGTATERDVLEIAAREDRLCELVDGVLVEKPMGYGESILALFLGHMLRNFVVPRNLGHVTGEQGMLRLFPGLVRIPDVAFASWDRFPQRRWTGEPIPDLVPDLAVEVLSESNTPAEMSIKVGEYFSAGVRLVWLVHPSSRTATVFTAADDSVALHEQDTLDGAAVLPGFTLSLRELFAELDRHG
jgi:Uma2 family endonuclease